METIFKIAVIEMLNKKYSFWIPICTNSVQIIKVYPDGFDYFIRFPYVSGFYSF